jgi:ribonuclease VapC
MIVDTSVIVGILRNDPDVVAMEEGLARPETHRMSAVSYVEAAVVVDSNRNPVLSRRFDDLLREVEMVIEPVT